MMLITNYITSAWRNILRHKLFSIINILGLAIGLAAVMLIALYVRYETSYDSFWKNADSIYLSHMTVTPPGTDSIKTERISAKLRQYYIKDFQEIEAAARIIPPSPTPNVSHNNQTFEENVILADEDIINIFDFTVIAGNLDTALNANNNVVITESTALKYFNNKHATGETLSIDFNFFARDYFVAAVIEDLPNNTMLDFTAFALFDENDFRDAAFLDNDYWPVAFFYFKVAAETDISVINQRMPNFIDRNFTTQLGVSDDKRSDVVTLTAMNIKKLHLYSEGDFNGKPRGNKNTIFTFVAVSVLILLIAAINFMNLSTARAGIRSKEISLRKLSGANKNKLVTQFIFESVLFALAALLLALTIVEVFLPFYSDILNQEVVINYMSGESVIIVLLALTVSVISGLYPAFFLSSLRPAVVLKSSRTAETKGVSRLRKILVILQFSISVTLFVATAVIFYQMDYVKSKDLGFNKENLLILPVNNRAMVTSAEHTLLGELKSLPNVINVTKTGFTVGNDNSSAEVYYTEQIPEENPLIAGYRTVGYDFFKTYDIPLLAGRAYQRGRSDEKPTRAEVFEGNDNIASVILNKSALDLFNFGSPQEAIGKILYQMIGNEEKTSRFTYEVIGVVDDLNLTSLKHQVQPEIYDLVTDFTETITIRYSGAPKEIISDVEAVWANVIPGVPFKYDHIIDNLINQYLTEKGQLTMFAAFSGLAIFIACLGLFGLASFTAERRTKEIGIRKVFGAEVWQIVHMLVLQFSKPVLIANIIAWPIAYLAMSRWLESFVYRIDDMMIIALCLIAGLTALLIAWATVAGNSYAVARQNPINALRYE